MHQSARACARLCSLCAAAVALAALVLPALAADDKAAEQLLTSARQAFDQKNFPAALERYRDFLAKFADHKDAPAARLGLALALFEQPEPDFAAAVDQLQMIAGKKDFADYPAVLYHLGVAQRGLGAKDRAKAGPLPPQQADPLNAQAKQRFQEAAKQFAAAAQAWSERARNADAKDMSPEYEWVVRARANQAEMLLECEQAREAQAAIAPLVKDSRVAKSRFSRPVLYLDGWSRFLLKDYHAAGRSLTPLVSFGDAGFGTHARYLLGRIHHLEDERAEAAAQYEGLLNDHEAHRKNATDALRRGGDLRRQDPKQWNRLQALVRGPAPEHVACANFYLGVLNAEAGRFGDALPRFAAFAKNSPRSPLMLECQLRMGICHVQLKQFPEAARTLQPLLQQPQLADQVLYWMGRASAGSADPANPPAAKQALARAVEAFQRAAAQAKERAQTDPDGKKWQGIILLELADTLQQAGQFKEAAATYEAILNDKVLLSRDAEVLQRLVDALNLAGDFAASDKAAARFQEAYPKSMFLPAVLFRVGENAAFQLAAIEKDPQFPNRDKEIERLSAESAKRYQTLIDRFPEFEYAGLARYGMGLAHYRKGEYEKAQAIFAGIASGERKDDLALAGYLQADCIIRLAPVKVEDAVAGGKLGEDMAAAIEQLDGFCSTRGPFTADGLLRLGYCKQRLASIAPNPQEKAKLLTEARVAYKRIYAEYPQTPTVSFAVFEEAKCFVGLGNLQRALTNLQRFNNELKNSPVAPVALLNLATIMRAQNRAADAANIMGAVRGQYEAGLKSDKARAAWVPLLQLHHGICLRESGKHAEARAVFDGLLKDFPDAPEAAEAALRRGQCLKEETLPNVDRLRQRLAGGGLKPEELAEVGKQLDEGSKALADAAQYLETQAKALEKKEGAGDVRARMLYEAAWAQRAIADTEIVQARLKLIQEQKKDVPLTAVPVQPAEKKTRQLYEALIAAVADHPRAVDARLELGEMLAERGDTATAIKLYSEALDQEPAPEVADKIRIRLGIALAAKGDPKTAQAQLESVAKNPKSPLNGLANQQLQALRANKPLPPLPPLGAFRAERAALDDATAMVSLANATSPIHVQRTRPAPFLRLTLPDPYEFHYVIKLPVTLVDDVIPVPGAWPMW
jgi:cellulose synthase operon protein C